MMTSSVVFFSRNVSALDTPQLEKNLQYNQAVAIISKALTKCDAVTTRQEALTLVMHTIAELQEHGLLSKGMNGGLVQRYITQAFLHSQMAPHQYRNSNGSGNSNCLIIGLANMTYFRPFPTILDIPLISHLAFDNSSPWYFNLLAFPYAFRTLQPFKFGPYAFIGGRLKETMNGSVTLDDIRPTVGWVWTFGANGSQKWKGSFFGNLSVRYQNGSFKWTTYEWWDPIGIRGFVGINFFDLISFSGGNHFPSIYIGFARKVGMTYEYPWPQ